LLAGIAALAFGCGSSGDASVPAASRGGTPSNPGPFPTANGAAPAPPTAVGTGVDTPSAAPPEVEMTIELALPQAAQGFVYAVNPSAGNVAVIDAMTQAIRVVKTGDQPTYLRTLAGTDDAIVLNVGSNKASILRTSADTTTKNDLDVVPGANAIAVAADGKHAVVYFDASRPNAGNASGSYQDVSVLQLAAAGDADAAISMTVGFRPRDVFFADDGSRAFVVTEDGISDLDFDQIANNQPGIARLITFGSSVDQKTLDVAFTPDGRFAVARADGKSVLELLELATGSVKELDLAKVIPQPMAAGPDDDAGIVTPAVPVEVTDLDLLPNGSAALAVLRNQSQIVTIPLPDGFDTPSQITSTQVAGEVIGSVTIAPDGRSALAYTTAFNVERITLLDLTGGAAAHTVLLRKAVAAVAFTPDSQTALITHTKLDGSTSDKGISPDDVIDRSFGYSLLRVAGADVKLQVTPTQLGPIAMVPDGSFLFILFRDDPTAVKEVQRVSLQSFLVDPIIQLENPPLSIGIVPSGTVFVNLEHPDGRMTFIDWNEPLTKLKTVTGFELNSRIRD
jgi:hypothetical protein